MARGGSVVVQVGSAVIQVSRGDLGPALWELARAQEIKINPTAWHDEAQDVKRRKEAGYKILRYF